MPTHKSVTQALLSIDKRLRQGFLVAIDNNTKILQTYYVLAVANWKGKPVFKRETEVTRDLMIGRIKIEGSEENALHWLWTDEGTKPHTITAKRVPRLKFQVGFNPKTRAVAQSSVGDGSKFGAWVNPITVDHPGTEARNFTKTWAKKQRPLILLALRAQVRKISK